MTEFMTIPVRLLTVALRRHIGPALELNASVADAHALEEFFELIDKRFGDDPVSVRGSIPGTQVILMFASYALQGMIDRDHGDVYDNGMVRIGKYVQPSADILIPLS